MQDDLESVKRKAEAEAEESRQMLLAGVLAAEQQKVGLAAQLKKTQAELESAQVSHGGQSWLPSSRNMGGAGAELEGAQGS